MQDRSNSAPIRLGMMQPYFFPYPGHLALIAATNRWVVFDTAQYMRRAWVNRNRIVSDNADGWQYLTVPVSRHPRDSPIREITIRDPGTLADKIVRQLDVYRRRRAPYYQETTEQIHSIVSAAVQSSDRLVELLIGCLGWVAEQLRIPWTPQLFSELEVRQTDDVGPGEWALRTAEHLRADEYLNPIGGRELFSGRDFQEAGVGLRFLEWSGVSRVPAGSERLNGSLSILDGLMWEDRDRLREWVADYRIVHAAIE